MEISIVRVRVARGSVTDTPHHLQHASSLSNAVEPQGEGQGVGSFYWWLPKTKHGARQERRAMLVETE